MSDTTFYLRSSFVTTSRESIPRELRCALVEIQSKTALVTSKSAEGPTLLSAHAMSDTTFYLRSRFVTTSRESIPRELRCALVEIQSKTALVTSKSAEGPTLLSAHASERIRENFYLK
ncbi:hypothetical protein V1478_006392 [Vespula squamosa]|uniref:Uncharacterized protein n=1 Tax=Vespula squamosa TaxID=30214 RepID=A0ABD2B7R8_VESSQ